MFGFLKKKTVSKFIARECAASCIKAAKTLLPSFSSKYAVFPGFCDVHVHFREPGFSYKETILSGSEAAARGGYTAVCTMPNLNPVPDSVEHIAEQIKIIGRDACIDVLPYGSITVGQKGEELSDMDGMAPYAIAFSDDGRGVQSDDMMRAAMIKCRELDKILVAHCEDMRELKSGGCIHEGEFAKAHGYVGINSESEWKQVERDLKLVRETGCKYHVCHVSTAETVELIRQAKAEGLDVTCETGPHYLVMCDMDIKEEGRFKMNPPIRSARDRDALVRGLCDGTIDMIATDHAPHSAEEKAKGLRDSAFGVVGLETAFAVLYTELVKKNIITLDTLIEVMCHNPRKRFNIPVGEDFTVWDLNAKFKVDPADFLSMGHATPFEGKELFGKCLLTVKNGKSVYKAL